ncbi:MAG: DNA-processing protein DprA [Acidobacteria bacterium]|nr:DNA-processing protein DprA [Acidobacteriota bacterium]
MNAFVVSVTNHCYPLRLRERLGEGAPEQLTAVGNLESLGLPKTALFCSARCPGHVILAAYDQAARWRDEERCVISGFHSGVEKECLRILLRGRQPIIICPARNLQAMRLPADWKIPLAEDRLLLLSAFAPADRRITAELASGRNELVAALADEAVFAHITPGGHLAQLAQRIATWGGPQCALI